MFLRSPEEEEFVQIFNNYCKSENLPVVPGALGSFVNKHYKRTGKPFLRRHPRHVVRPGV